MIEEIFGVGKKLYKYYVNKKCKKILFCLIMGKCAILFINQNYKVNAIL